MAKLALVTADQPLPEPPYPAAIRPKGWRFELDYERIEQSDTWVLAPPELRPWLLMLWFSSWLSNPCGAFTNDDTIIAARIGMPLAMFRTHREILMRGWELHSDGRLYHPVIIERVTEMLAARDKNNQRQYTWRNRADRIKERDHHACVYCGATTYLTIDHLLALERGGNSDEANLVTACKSCNSKKRHRTPDEAGLTFVDKYAESLWISIRYNGAVTAGHARITVRSPSVTAPVPVPVPVPLGKDESPTDSSARPVDRAPACPHEAIIKRWNAAMVTLPAVDPDRWNERKQRLLRTRWREVWEFEGKKGRPRDVPALVAWFERLFAYCQQSKFLMGKVPGRDGAPPFELTFEWLLGPKNMDRVIAGDFHREGGKGR